MPHRSCLQQSLQDTAAGKKLTMGNLISIIVPVYNVEQYLPKCIDSILAQTYTDFELILVDDGSTDGSGKICDEFKKTDPRVIVVHKANGGQSSARNTALDMVKGEYIACIDADDWVDAFYLEQLLKSCLRYGAQLALCDMYFARVDGCYRGYNTKFTILQQPAALESILKEEVIKGYACAKLYKTELFVGLRYPEGRVFEDTALTYKLVHRCLSVVHTGEVRYYYRRRSDSTCGEFNPTSLYQWYLAMNEQVCYVREHCPEYLDCCMLKLSNWLLERYNIHLINQNDEGDSFFLIIFTDMKSLIGEILHNRSVGIWKKYAIIFLLTNRNCYDRLFSYGLPFSILYANAGIYYLKFRRWLFPMLCQVRNHIIPRRLYKR